MKTIVIVGGGFGGVACAMALAKKKLPDVRIRLISSKTHFEYHGALYRVITGRSPLEVCIPLSEVFAPYDCVELIHDTIVEIDCADKTITGQSASVYQYDDVVLALGSQVTYYDIPGLRDYTFTISSIHDALRLKRHLHQQFDTCVAADRHDAACATHIVVVGGGATGAETAAELSVYTKKLARSHGVDPGLITIDVIQAADRLVPQMPPAMSERILQRIQSLGVHVFLNKRVVKKDIERLYLDDMNVQAKTVIWAAGVQGNVLYKQAGLTVDVRGRVIVNEYLQAQDHVYVLGDGAATQYSGMAQTALYDGMFVGAFLAAQMRGKKVPSYDCTAPQYAIPVGPGWAAVLKNNIRYYGYHGWLHRRLLDWHVFRSVLPFFKALRVFRHGKVLCETCPMCCKADKQ